jgi:hypothetical protein
VRRAQRGRAARTARGGHGGEKRAGGRAGGAGGARCYRTARAAERAGREWAQRGGAILTCAWTAVAGVEAKTCPKDAEQEEWRDACRRRKCSRPEDLLLALAESEGRWRAVSVGGRARGGRGGGSGAAAGARRCRRTREDEGNWGGRRTGLGGDETQ